MIALALALVAADPPPYQSPPTLPSRQQVMVWGPTPSPSCGTWTNDRRAGNERSADVENWLAGLITGYNHYGPDPAGGTASGIDIQGIYAWVDQYCAANPLDNLVTAGFRLVDELERRRLRR
jgi:hypothetical protein